MKKSAFEKPRQGVLIEGVGVNIDAPDFDDVESLEDIRKLEIFDHLDLDKKNKAELKLAEKLGIKSPVKIEVGDKPKL